MNFFSGPQCTRDFLKKITDIYEKDGGKDSEVLKKYNSAKLSERFDHFVVVNIKNENNNSLPVSIFTDSDGRIFSGIATVELTNMASSIYSVDLNDETRQILSKEYCDFFKIKNPIITKSIFHTPFKIFFLSVFGNERLIKKEFLKEILSGQNYFSFTKTINDEIFSSINKYYRKWLTTSRGNIMVFPYQENLKLFFSIPDLPNLDGRSIIIELSRLFSEKFINKVALFESSSLPPNIKLGVPVSMAVETSLLNIDKIIYKLKDFYLFYVDTLEKTIDYLDDYIKRNFEL
ncbi:MAG: hypothetical protein PWQ77_965 [Kosmotogales bacterium]|nr:hypothetical protein [Kosmotogales bacterium]